MANLKDELSAYLSRNDDRKNVSVSVKLPIPQFNIFSHDDEPLIQKTRNRFTRICPSLTRLQKIIGFGICLAMSIFFYTLSVFYLPVLLLKARKFALLYTLGTTFFFISFAFLWGPLASLKHLLSKDQRLFMVVFTISFIGTMYFSMWEQNTLLTVLFAVLQNLSLLRYVTTYIPGGTMGLSFLGNVFRSTASRTLPV